MIRERVMVGRVGNYVLQLKQQRGMVGERVRGSWREAGGGREGRRLWEGSRR